MLLDKYGNILDLSKVKSILNKIALFIAHNQEYFNQKWQVFNEYELMKGDSLHRINRLMIDKVNKEIMILDYKSGYIK